MANGTILIPSAIHERMCLLLCSPGLGRCCLESAVPMLGDFSVVETEHVEPGSGVLLALVGWGVVLSHKRKCDDVAFGLDGHQAWQSIGNRCRPAQPGKELFEAL